MKRTLSIVSAILLAGIGCKTRTQTSAAKVESNSISQSPPLSGTCWAPAEKGGYSIRVEAPPPARMASCVLRTPGLYKFEYVCRDNQAQQTVHLYIMKRNEIDLLDDQLLAITDTDAVFHIVLSNKEQETRPKSGIYVDDGTVSFLFNAGTRTHYNREDHACQFAAHYLGTRPISALQELFSSLK